MSITAMATNAITQCQKEYIYIYMSHHVVFDELEYPFTRKDDLVSTNFNAHEHPTVDQVVLGQSFLSPITKLTELLPSLKWNDRYQWV